MIFNLVITGLFITIQWIHNIKIFINFSLKIFGYIHEPVVDGT